MRAEIRERLGQAAFAAEQIRLGNLSERGPAWDGFPHPSEERREDYRVMAEAVLMECIEILMPIVHAFLSEDEIKRLLKTLE